MKAKKRKRNKIIFWTSTGMVTVTMLFSVFGYFTNIEMKAAFVHLGFPNYFWIELGILKLLGAVALVVPIVPGKLKEFAYFSFAITFVSGLVGHLASADPVSMAIMPVLFLRILAVSYPHQHNRETSNLH